MVSNLTTPDLGQVATGLPPLPRLPIGALVVGAADLLGDAADLPQPRYITVSSTQHIGVQFAPEGSSFAALAAWACRFGGVLISEPDTGSEEPQTRVGLEFSYYGVEITAYAYIPAETATA